MKKLFRVVVTASMIIYSVFWFLPNFHYLLASTEMLNILSFNGLERSLKFPELVGWAFLFAWLLVSIGLLTFNSSARLQFIVLSIISLVIVPFSGLMVLHPLDALLFSIIGMLDGAIIVMFYLTPIANEFKTTHKTL